MITDFFDVMKSRSKGYASMEYAVIDYRENDLVRLDILISGEKAAPLATIVHREASHTTGKAMTRKLKELIPRAQFKVSRVRRAQFKVRLTLLETPVKLTLTLELLN